MRYETFDIVIGSPELGGKIFAIVQIDLTRADLPYIVVKLDKGPFKKRYRLAEKDIFAKIESLASKETPGDDSNEQIR